MKTKIFLSILFLGITLQIFGQKIKTKNMLIATGKTAITAWEKGENTGNYNDFKALLSTEFNSFSHPLIGKFIDTEAKLKLNNLIAERENVSNNLTFSNLTYTSSPTSIAFQFNSKGMVQGGKFPYEGFNIIVFHIAKNKIIGFQEYFGFVDPNWFK